jgi:hypothetical protein
MRLALSAPDFLPWSRLAPDVRESIAAFAAELVDAAIPASIAA